MHHCVRGADLIDLYVARPARGLGVSLRLVAAVCAAVHARGGVFLSGQSVSDPDTHARYERVAMTLPGATCIVGGRAFRTLATLAGAPARKILRGLPPREWNQEP